jgi:hypothetical protein
MRGNREKKLYLDLMISNKSVEKLHKKERLIINILSKYVIDNLIIIIIIIITNNREKQQQE